MLIIFQTVSVPLLAFAFSLIGIALGLSYYSSLYYSLCGDGDAGRRSGIHELMVGSAFFLGPLLGASPPSTSACAPRSSCARRSSPGPPRGKLRGGGYRSAAPARSIARQLDSVS